MLKKVLSKGITRDQIQRIMPLNQFSVAESGHVYRTARYIEASSTYLVMEAIHGRTLKSIVCRSGSLAASEEDKRQASIVAELAGRWLRHFHAWPIEDGSVEQYDPAARAVKAKENLDLLARGGLSNELVRRIASLVDSVRGADPGGASATIHGDFKPANIMIAGRDVVGIDMEGYHRGHPLVDLGQFLAHLFLCRSSAWSYAGKASWWRRLGEQFILGYLQGGPVALPCLDFRLMEALLNIAADLFRRRGRLYWRIRGRSLLDRTAMELIANPLSRTTKS